MISRILVPVDFSEGATAALRYAEGLAAFIGAAEVRVIHVFTPQTATGDTLSVAPVGQLMEERDQRLEQYLASLPTPAGVKRRHELLLGFAADKIVDQSEAFDLIVMGASGETDLLEELFGSISSAVSQRANCPVLLVPGKAAFSNYEHILYASNSLSLSRRAVLEFMDFNELFNARVHFVHVNDEEGRHDGQRERLFAPLFKTSEPEFAFEIREVTAESVREGLAGYLQEHEIDLAVMVTRQRGFWARLFHHSESRQMVLSPTTPLLILHLEEA